MFKHKQTLLKDFMILFGYVKNCFNEEYLVVKYYKTKSMSAFLGLLLLNHPKDFDTVFTNGKSNKRESFVQFEIFCENA